MTTRYDRWEYQVETGDVDTARLNALGNDGWELVTALPEGNLVFKRPAPNLRERITLDQRAAVDASQRPEGAS